MSMEFWLGLPSPSAKLSILARALSAKRRQDGRSFVINRAREDAQGPGPVTGNVFPDAVKVRLIDVVYAAIRGSTSSVNKANEWRLKEVAIRLVVASFSPLWRHRRMSSARGVRVHGATRFVFRVIT
jgi:hypothetical protein